MCGPRSTSRPSSPRSTDGSLRAREGGSSLIRHIALFRWKAGTEQAAVDALAERLASLPAVIPEIRRYEMGTDLALREGNHDFALVADFDDEAAWRTYSAHPEHVEVVRSLVSPILEEAVRIQHRL